MKKPKHKLIEDITPGMDELENSDIGRDPILKQKDPKDPEWWALAIVALMCGWVLGSLIWPHLFP